MKRHIILEAWRLIWVLITGVAVGYLSSAMLPGITITLLLYSIWQATQLLRVNHWLERGLKRSQTPDAGGVLAKIISNITRMKNSQKRGKKRLALLLGQFRASAEALPDATIILTTSGEIEWLNEAAESLLGLQSPRDIGQRIDNLLRDPEFRQYLYNDDRQTELRLVSPLDAEVFFACRIINYGNNKLLLTARDISIREQLNRVRREFVSNASHELRTPLTVIKGYLDIMSSDKNTSDELRNKLSILLDQSEQMEKIISEMLTLSRLENAPLDAGEGELINVSRIIQKLFKEAIQSGRASEGQLTLSIDNTLCLLGKTEEIISIANNLLYNALQHNLPETQVDIQWFRSGSGAPCLVVSDNGEGIEQHHLNRLTERFYRVDSSRSRESGGTGLGLAIVKHIVQRHGGRIDISSIPGDGSSFTCCFAPSRAVECNNEKI